MREYGRYLQQFMEMTLNIKNKTVQQKTARELFHTMSRLSAEKGNSQEKNAKIWNHLACLSDYKLDLEYPVEITRK